MIKRIVAVVIFGSLMIACGSKKRVSHTKKTTERTVKKPAERAAVKEYKQEESVLYPLPEDTGDFVQFSINSVEEYIASFADIARFEMKAYGIPASITLAQGILESGAGRGSLTQRTNNHFGIKCHTGWEGDYDFHDDDEKGECFRKYNHPMYSFRDRSIFLSTRARYAFLFDLEHDDYVGWAKGLKKAGYATDRKYPDKLISVIKRYGLDKYDQEVIKTGRIVKKEPKQYNFETYVVKKGDTLYSIARRYFVTVSELMELNNMKSSDLAIGQRLTVKAVKK
ncbi:glucosaminidase domain-containing protein [Arenibacter latericius]|uniref:glucosaminidase domain-containing protein n=1 Tax=Arenibacter latericius TaxID=86104 RepID=UPI0004273A9A|nr:glucosaminidase domain-containing protein [Arenibacter latericius]MDX1364437.1 glucosaminidase domain-containing protein [Arenibacter latericius]